MAIERITAARMKTIGSRQTLKAIHKEQARVVFVALDADHRVTEPIIEACRAKGTLLVEVDTMRELGLACGIAVGCASAAVIEE